MKKLNIVYVSYVLLCLIGATRNPDTFDDYIRKGNTAFQKKDYVTAIEYYNQILDIDQYYFKAIYNKAQTFYQMKEYKAAIEEYKKALDIVGDTASFSSVLYLNLGNAFFKNGDFDDAVSSYKTALSLRPSEKSIIHNLEAIYFLNQSAHIKISIKNTLPSESEEHTQSTDTRDHTLNDYSLKARQLDIMKNDLKNDSHLKRLKAFIRRSSRTRSIASNRARPFVDPFELPSKDQPATNILFELEKANTNAYSAIQDISHRSNESFNDLLQDLSQKLNQIADDGPQRQNTTKEALSKTQRKLESLNAEILKTIDRQYSDHYKKIDAIRNSTTVQESEIDSKIKESMNTMQQLKDEIRQEIRAKTKITQENARYMSYQENTENGVDKNATELFFEDAINNTQRAFNNEYKSIVPYEEHPLSSGTETELNKALRKQKAAALEKINSTAVEYAEQIKKSTDQADRAASEDEFLRKKFEIQSDFLHKNLDMLQNEIARLYAEKQKMDDATDSSTDDKMKHEKTNELIDTMQRAIAESYDSTEQTKRSRESLKDEIRIDPDETKKNILQEQFIENEKTGIVKQKDVDMRSLEKMKEIEKDLSKRSYDKLINEIEQNQVSQEHNDQAMRRLKAEREIDQKKIEQKYSALKKEIEKSYAAALQKQQELFDETRRTYDEDEPIDKDQDAEKNDDLDRKKESANNQIDDLDFDIPFDILQKEMARLYAEKQKMNTATIDSSTDDKIEKMKTNELSDTMQRAIDESQDIVEQTKSIREALKDEIRTDPDENEKNKRLKHFIENEELGISKQKDVHMKSLEKMKEIEKQSSKRLHEKLSKEIEQTQEGQEHKDNAARRLNTEREQDQKRIEQEYVKLKKKIERSYRDALQKQQMLLTEIKYDIDSTERDSLNDQREQELREDERLDQGDLSDHGGALQEKEETHLDANHEIVKSVLKQNRDELSDEKGADHQQDEQLNENEYSQNINPQILEALEEQEKMHISMRKPGISDFNTSGQRLPEGYKKERKKW